MTNSKAIRIISRKEATLIPMGWSVTTTDKAWYLRYKEDKPGFDNGVISTLRIPRAYDAEGNKILHGDGIFKGKLENEY